MSDVQPVARHSDRVRALLLANPANPPDLTHAARHLGHSPRTLRRLLREESTSFRTLLTDTRRTHAVALLQAGLTVDQVATRMGYGDVSNFSHAFRRWTGSSPRAYLAIRHPQ